MKRTPTNANKAPQQPPIKSPNCEDFSNEITPVGIINCSYKYPLAQNQMNISSPIDVMTTEQVNKKLFFLGFMTYLDFVAKIHIIVYFTVSLVGFFATLFPGTHGRK